MPITRAALIAICLLVRGSSVASAQRCLGTASFASGTIRAGMNAHWGEREKSVGAEIGVGRPGGLFGLIALDRMTFDGLSEGATLLGGTAGYAARLTNDDQVEVCAFASYAKQDGPNESLPVFAPGGGLGASTVEVSASIISYGIALGGVATATDALEFVPFASAVYTTVRSSVSFGGFPTSSTQNFTVVQAGFGYVIGRKATIRPAISYPFGVDGAKATYLVSVLVNF